MHTVALAVLAGVALCGMGCGGLGASGSISPATFLLPGLGHTDPKGDLHGLPPQDVAVEPASPQVAAYSAALVQ